MPQRLGPPGTTYAGGGIVASWINSVLDAKAAADGSTDDTAALQAASDKAVAAGHRSVFVQPGTYKVSGPVRYGGGVAGKFRVICVIGTAFIRSTVGVACSFVGSIANNKLTVSSITAGALCVGCNVNYGSGWVTINAANADGTWAVTESASVAAGTSMTAGAPIVLFGDGVSPTTGLLDGEISGLNISGPTNAPTSGSTGLMLCAMRHVRVSHCEVNNTTVGYDMINNCYGVSLDFCRAGFYGSCQVGWHVRGPVPGLGQGDAGAGNQISAYQSWLCGAAAGVQVGLGTDGLSLRDGQLGVSGTDDAYGCLVIGKAYYTGATGGVGCILVDGVDTEGFAAWKIRIYGECNLTVRAPPTISYSIPQSIPWGLVKITNGGNGHIDFNGVSMRGNFRAAAPIVVESSYPNLVISDAHSALDPTSKYGVAADGSGGTTLLPAQCQSLVLTSVGSLGNAVGYSIYSDWATGKLTLYLGGVSLRGGNGQLQVSSDGVTFAAVATAGVDPTLDPNVGPVLDPALIRSPDGTAIGTAMDPSYTQGTAAAQPVLRSLYATAQLANGKPVYVFDGASTFFDSSASAGGAQTVYVVLKFGALTSGTQAIFGSNTAGGLSLSASGNNTLVLNNDSVVNLGNVSVALDTTRYHVIVASYASPGAWSVWYDGRKLGSGTSNSTLNASTTRTIGRQSNGYCMNANVAAVVPLTAASSDSQIIAGSKWLKQLFGTP